MSDRKTVMLVEDHSDMQQYICSILEQQYHLIVCSNGEEALQKLNDQAIDLIISDVMMPVMDGFTLLDNIKSNVEYGDIPLVMLTALDCSDNKLKALTIGADDYLTKPFDALELKARVYNLISRYEQRKGTRLEIDSLQEEMDKADKKIPDAIKSLMHQNNNTSVNKEDLKLIEELAILIENNLENSDFKLSDLSKSCYLEERQLRTKIKLVTGLTPKKFQQEIALRKARNLLESGKYISVKAIAYSIGMSHVTRFSKLYVERFGKQPSSYFEGAEFSIENLR